jgi:hypothetical protein
MSATAGLFPCSSIGSGPVLEGGTERGLRRRIRDSAAEEQAEGASQDDWIPSFGVPAPLGSRDIVFKILMRRGERGGVPAA